MRFFELNGSGGSNLRFSGECIASVEALNHDDTVRCSMHLYREENAKANAYICHRIDRPNTIDVRYRVERCADVLTVYQFFGTEPLANYLYGITKLEVPGLRQIQI